MKKGGMKERKIKVKDRVRVIKEGRKEKNKGGESKNDKRRDEGGRSRWRKE